MGSLLEALESFEIEDVEMQGEMNWSLDEEKGFIMKSMYTALCPFVRSSSLGVCVEQFDLVEGFFFH